MANIDPNTCEDYNKKKHVEEELEKQRQRLQNLQERLYAQHQRSLLIVLQAMDTGGKDGTIKHVFGGLNPQGCQVWSFKKPSDEEFRKYCGSRLKSFIYSRASIVGLGYVRQAMPAITV
ncbi:MAG: hypothetical protein V7K26_25505 [Nostoc sp.]|uniref:hypothetical protein n=1 Tax=Nostoc sp. TaxID=1180 RepID=UPI002FEEB981